MEEKEYRFVKALIGSRNFDWALTLLEKERAQINKNNRNSWNLAYQLGISTCYAMRDLESEEMSIVGYLAYVGYQEAARASNITAGRFLALSRASRYSPYSTIHAYYRAKDLVRLFI